MLTWTDSTAGKSVVSRRGLGKMRHVELKYLCVQEIVKQRRLNVRKKDGVGNIADHLAKAKERGRHGTYDERSGMRSDAGAEKKRWTRRVC